MLHFALATNSHVARLESQKRLPWPLSLVRDFKRTLQKNDERHNRVRALSSFRCLASPRLASPCLAILPTIQSLAGWLTGSLARSLFLTFAQPLLFPHATSLAESSPRKIFMACLRIAPSNSSIRACLYPQASPNTKPSPMPAVQHIMNAYSCLE